MPNKKPPADGPLEEIKKLTEKNIRYSEALRDSLYQEQAKRDEATKKLLKENLEYSKSIYILVKKINRHLIWQRVFKVIYILLIVIPIVLGIIYLPPLIRKAVEPYQDLLQLDKDQIIQELKSSVNQ